MIQAFLLYGTAGADTLRTSFATFARAATFIVGPEKRFGLDRTAQTTFLPFVYLDEGHRQTLDVNHMCSIPTARISKPRRFKTAAAPRDRSAECVFFEKRVDHVDHVREYGILVEHPLGVAGILQHLDAFGICRAAIQFVGFLGPV